MAARLTYLEIPAVDVARTARFYGAVCGWEIEQRAEDDFRFSDDDARLIGRWVKDRAPAGDAGLRPYFTVPDVAAALERAVAAGGAVVTPRTREDDIWLARLRDPSGNVLGIWQFVEPRQG